MMPANEETIHAILDAKGGLHLEHPSRLTAGPVEVTIRAAQPLPRRGLADLVREISAEQRAGGFLGRSQSAIDADEAAKRVEDVERDQELESARRIKAPWRR